MPVEIVRAEIDDKGSPLFGERMFLSFMLWSKYVESRDNESLFSVVCFGGNEEFGYEVGHVYLDLRFDSCIHPSCYVNLTWGEFYRWYGLFDWELNGGDKESVCFDEKEGIRPLQEIILDYKRKVNMDLGIVQCPHCNKVVVGTANLQRHMKACKSKLCASCERKDICKDSCFNDPYNFIIVCDKSAENQNN